MEAYVIRSKETGLYYDIILKRWTSKIHSYISSLQKMRLIQKQLITNGHHSGEKQSILEYTAYNLTSDEFHQKYRTEATEILKVVLTFEKL